MAPTHSLSVFFLESKEFVDTTFETGLPTTRGCDTLIMGLTSAAGKVSLYAMGVFEKLSFFLYGGESAYLFPFFPSDLNSDPCTFRSVDQDPEV